MIQVVRKVVSDSVTMGKNVEREKGFEPSTSTLARWATTRKHRENMGQWGSALTLAYASARRLAPLGGARSGGGGLSRHRGVSCTNDSSRGVSQPTPALSALLAARGAS